MERRVLSEAFQRAMEGRRLHAAVFLTFRFDPGFFEQEILPVFFDIPLSHAPIARVLHLADALRTSGPVAVYYDRRALVAGAAPARTDFAKIGITHRTGYFHPKNALLLLDRGNGSRERSLIVASLSANLTRAGWWENVEAAHFEVATPDQPCGFRDDLLALIDLLRRIVPEGADHAALDEVRRHVQTLQQDPQRLKGGLLVPRLFSGERDLADFLQDVAGSRLRNRCLEVISPYFDDRESAKPLRRLVELFRPRETRVFLPRGRQDEALCSGPYWRAIQEAGATWAALPADLTRLSGESERLVHAKVYRFFDPLDRRQTFFVGSVNLTNAGFGKAGNVESGFVVELEGRTKSDWLLQADERRPPSFVHQAESDEVMSAPGANLVLRFDWSTGCAIGLWDAFAAPPTLEIRGAGVPLGVIRDLPAREKTVLAEPLAAALREHLLSSCFVTVAIAEEPDAIVLVEEQGSVDKPPLLATLSPDEILRFWSLLTEAQKQEFFETHASELPDDYRVLWMGEGLRVGEEPGIFGTFAHVYLSFGNLERAVRAALDEGRYKEAVDRLFGRKFDSLRRLVERIRDRDDPAPVRDYVTMLCAIHLLRMLIREVPELYQRERRRFDLLEEARAALADVKTRFTFAEPADQEKFFAWFEPWFLQRAKPPTPEPSS